MVVEVRNFRLFHATHDKSRLIHVNRALWADAENMRVDSVAQRAYSAIITPLGFEMKADHLNGFTILSKAQCTLIWVWEKSNGHPVLNNDLMVDGLVHVDQLLLKLGEISHTDGVHLEAKPLAGTRSLLKR